MKLKHVFKDALDRALRANDYEAINRIANTMHNCGIKSIKIKKPKRSL